MREIIVDSFVTWPMPAAWLLALALLLGRRRRWSYHISGAVALALLLGSMPAVGRLATIPLAAAAPPLDPGAAPPGLAAVVVATGGSFRDPAGEWHSEPETIRRLAAARIVRDRLDVPLIVAGGAPRAGDQPPEALTAVRDFAMAGLRFVLREEAARNSAETGANVAALLHGLAGGARHPRVVLVTSGAHVARMAAVLRHNGVDVFAAATPESLDPRLAPDRGARAFLPSVEGLRWVAVALYEYAGIAWYWGRGYIDLSDLRRPIG